MQPAIPSSALSRRHFIIKAGASAALGATTASGASSRAHGTDERVQRITATLLKHAGG